MREEDATPDQGLKKTTRRKRYFPKTRTGCLTCRVRRVKCDEAKPDCQRCTSTGRKCDGYFDNAVVSPRSDTSACPPQAALSSDPESSTLEKKTFEWFRYQTVPILAGHFPDETYNRTALQLYFSEPAVRFTISAFGALHQEIYSTRKARNAGVSSNLRTRLPAQQYARALREVQSLLALQDVPLEVVLVCSALLVQFEGLQQDFVPAMLHAEKALSLLAAARPGRIEEGLLRTMMRFDAQSAMHVGRRAPQLATHAAHLDRELPPALRSAVEARFLVTTWSSRLYAFSQAVADRYVLEPGGVALEHLAQAQQLEQTFTRLDALLAAFLATHAPTLPIREQHGLLVLQTRAKILRVFAATALTSEATLFDAHLPAFRAVLALCTRLLTDPRADRRLFVIHADEGLLYPLYVLSTYCRDGRVRHAAFDLLRTLPTGSGFRIWHADIVIRTAKVIMEYEEDGREGLKCEDVPEWRRVHHARFDDWDLSAWQSGVGGPLRVRPNGMDGEWMDLRMLLDGAGGSTTEEVEMLHSPLNRGMLA